MATALIAFGRLVRLVVTVIVAIIVLAIVLQLLSANPGNAIVRDIHDAGNWLVGPFRDVFSLKSSKAAVAVNWGLAAVVYLIVGGLIARLIAMSGARAPVRRRSWYRGRRGGPIGPIGQRG